MDRFLRSGQRRRGAIYQPDAFFSLERAVTQPTTPDFYPWNYPPSSFLIIYSLALLPYLHSLAVWLALGLAGYLAALWRIFPKPLTLWVGLAFPAVFWTVTHGQTSLLMTSVFCWGLLQLPRRPVLAGILLGFLTFKPHLGLLLPFALVAVRHWRAVVAAAFTAILSAAASIALFGTGVWSDFLASTTETRSMLESGLHFGHYYKLQSVFAAARLLGLSMLVAYSLQALVLRSKRKIHFFVLAGLVPAIHVTRHTPCRFPWIPGTRPGKTIGAWD